MDFNTQPRSSIDVSRAQRASALPSISILADEHLPFPRQEEQDRQEEQPFFFIPSTSAAPIVRLLHARTRSMTQSISISLTALPSFFALDFCSHQAQDRSRIRSEPSRFSSSSFCINVSSPCFHGRHACSHLAQEERAFAHAMHPSDPRPT
jgi:hypothetical protein